MFSSAKQFLVLVKNVVWLIFKESLQWIHPTEPKSVRDDVILVTGGGRGIGREIALEFATHQPAHIIVVGRAERPLQKTAEDIHGLGVNCSYMICDVSNKEEIYSCAKEVKAKFGAVTILVNNAGVVHNNDIVDADPKDIEHTFQVNLLALFWTLKAFLPDMLQKNKGHIVNISSVLGLFGLKGAADYCSSKFATTGLSEALRQELLALGSTGVKVTSIHPYHVDNDMFSGMKTRLSYFVPSLSEKDVAKATVTAVLLDRAQVLMPRLMYLACLMNSIMPVTVTVLMSKAFGVDHAMETIVKSATSTTAITTITAATATTTTVRPITTTTPTADTAESVWTPL